MQEQIKDQLAEQKAQENEVGNFVKACRVMEQRVSKDIQVIRTHLEKYGYQAPCNTQRTTSKLWLISAIIISLKNIYRLLYQLKRRARCSKSLLLS